MVRKDSIRALLAVNVSKSRPVTSLQARRHAIHFKPILDFCEGQPIVITGAMTPLGLEGSDGLQNLTESLLAARMLACGIHVVMLGQILPVDRVRKDHALGRFLGAETLVP